MGWWSSIWRTRAEDWIYSSLEPEQTPDNLVRAEITPDTKYLNVFLRSMRITSIRKGLSKFYGTVHSYISVPYITKLEPAEFQVVATPSELKNQDAKHLDRVIKIDQRLLGPIPYRGGDVEVEVALFSVKSADLAEPFITVLEQMSSLAGVSYISTALPFMRPLKDGINLLTGADNDTILEIGLATTFSKPQTGYYFIMRAKKGEVNPKSLKVDKDYRLVDGSGSAVKDYPYLVLAVEATDEHGSWFQIPELSNLYGDLQNEIRKYDLEGAKEVFASFRRTALTSPDLLTTDANRLVEMVEKKIQEVMKGTATSSKTAELPDLKDIKLYGP